MREAKIYAVSEPPYSHIVLFRRKGYPSYKRRHRSLAAAKEDRDAFNAKLVAEGAGGVHIGPKERREIETAMRILDGTGIGLVRAAEIAVARWRHKEGGKDLRPLLDGFLEAKSGRTAGNLKSRLNAMIRHTGAKRVGDLTQAAIAGWVESYRHGTTRRNALAAANNFCAWLTRRDYLDANPCDRIERPRRERSDEKTILAPVEAWRFLRRLEIAFPEYVAFYAVLLFAFLRPSEAEGLRPADLRAKTIRVTRGKMRGRKRRAVPIRPNLRAWLDAYSWQVPTAALQKKCRQLAPVQWENDICRHTGISYRITETDDENQTAREAGNSPGVIYADYYELVRPEDVPFFFGIRPL